jgi:uncharacterized membrane protein
VIFASPLPAWALAPVFAGLAVLAWAVYRRVPLSPARRALLSTLRFLAFAWLVVCLMRPMGGASGADASDAIVPILVDASRSMSLADADGRRRIDQAVDLLRRSVQPAIAPQFHTDVLAFGDRLRPTDPATVPAADHRTDLAAALRSVRDRYRGRPIAGILLVSDGGDNGGGDLAAAVEGGPPVFAIGVGPRAAVRDREVLSVTAAESILGDSQVDVAATAVAHGFGTAPIELRLLENGRPIDLRRVAPAADGTPVSAVFRVAPARDAPTVYTVEIPRAPEEIVPENNARSALVPPARRPARVLLVQGAPGYEQAFLRRAWMNDAGLEIDSVVRKGTDDGGTNTFYVQAPRERATALVGGYPATREALFAYDVIVLANVDADDLTASALDLTRAFVGERGGGLLVLGARGFERQGLRGTPLEDVLPLDLSDRANGVVPAANVPAMNRVSLTRAGEDHPMMQLAATPDENARRWAGVPPLAAVSPLGAARPGASVLAVTAGPGGVPRALVAVQRYGEGRSMVFTGEASWRWRMMLPVSDQSYDRFWRQAVRWLGQRAPDPVAITLPAAPAPGAVTIDVDARDTAFAPQPDAAVTVYLTSTAGRVVSARAEAVPGRPGRFRASLAADEAGIYRVAAEARRGTALLGSASGTLLVGGVDPEMTDPRLNEETLRRVARSSNGAVIAASDVAGLAGRLHARLPAAALEARTDLWSTGWSFAVLVGLLASEWLVRRRWGLR